MRAFFRRGSAYRNLIYQSVTIRRSDLLISERRMVIFLSGIKIGSFGRFFSTLKPILRIFAVFRGILKRNERLSFKMQCLPVVRDFFIGKIFLRRIILRRKGHKIL